jgi:Ca2+-binding RTX toxin-like protein
MAIALTPNKLSTVQMASSSNGQRQPRSLVFIDTVLQDHESLVAGVTPGHEVVLLDAHQCGITQITQVLREQMEIASLHILSHGRSGELQLGNSVLNLENLAAHVAQLQVWRSAMSETAEILLYGCEVAKGDRGQTFVQQLAALTGGAIAASTTLTGNPERGGNWNLETQVGTPNLMPILTAQVQDSYPGILQIIVYRDGGSQPNGRYDEGEAVSTVNTLPIQGTNPSTTTFNFDLPAGIDLSQVRLEVEILTIDDHLRLSVNGTNLFTDSNGNDVSNSANNFIDLYSAAGARDLNGTAVFTPWDPNLNGLPRLNFMISPAGVDILGTLLPSSTQMVSLRLGDSGVTYTPPTFVVGQNTLVLENPNTGGPDGLNARISVAIVPVVPAGQSFTLRENSALNTTVGTLAGIPPIGRTLQNWQITWGNLDVNNNGTPAFAIDPATGRITVSDAGDLDFETQSSFSLRTTASDGSTTSTPQIVTVNLSDVPTSPVAILGTSREAMRIVGTARNDTRRTLGTNFDDDILGLSGQDTLRGFNGNDMLHGGTGNDLLDGGTGNDIVYGGSGFDRLIGGAGRDVFVLHRRTGLDTVTDFRDGQDRLGLSGGLQISDLWMRPVTGGTTIGIRGNNSPLMMLNNIQPRQLNAADFTVVTI